MTEAQRTAFTVASGNFDITFLYLVCVGFFLATLFLWAAWAAVDVWNGWANEKVRNQTISQFAMRTALLLVLAVWMFAS
ncbi:TIGR03758 family integrating conjugative element protein [Xenorhabdus bovienii]|uniref:TIGR03758 family integrating conjugative element protein n=1 Tax=Xenorhabdus bovienii TaxID=40576 RepID=UPI0023B34389|nr:TIGR03758 family integrating conjugative element protein [Xenorhabdus bovienii]MDE9433484.1 TIGR03758 family integrating conjugative element protein [Xenorhabdus bovienii]MDE9491124.1 TIGR03758 family integrating conjugative element protein [Xenorhabdus bovienii]MDE9507442.1 TIGR03758 family integrating conjugative element protein [Xenorhabdus bovienii]